MIASWGVRDNRIVSRQCLAYRKVQIPTSTAFWLIIYEPDITHTKRERT